MAAKVPKNVRFRKDQIAALAAMENAETDFSALVRIAVDNLIAARPGTRIAETPPPFRIVRETLSPRQIAFKRQPPLPARKTPPQPRPQKKRPPAK